MDNFLNNIVRVDDKIIKYFNDKNSATYAINFFRIYTQLAKGGLYGLITVFIMYFYSYTRHYSYILALAIVINAIVVNIFVKNFIKRPRPFEKHPEIKVLIKKPNDYSFPSGHTSVTAAITTIICYVLIQENLSIIFIFLNVIFLLLMGYSRIYLRVHYLSDVILGLGIGLLNGFLALLFKNYIISIGDYLTEILKKFIPIIN